jgi:hypothetical protein
MKYSMASSAVTTSSDFYISKIIVSPTLAANKSLLQWMNALIFENASSIGLRSGEYGGRYST